MKFRVTFGIGALVAKEVTITAPHIMQAARDAVQLERPSGTRVVCITEIPDPTMKHDYAPALERIKP